MTCFAVVWTTWAYDDPCAIFSCYLKSAGSNLIPGKFASVMTLNNCEIIAETRGYIFRWLNRCRRRRLCLGSLISPASGTNHIILDAFCVRKRWSPIPTQFRTCTEQTAASQIFVNIFNVVTKIEREHRGLVEILSVTFECKRNRTKTTQHPCPEGPLLIQGPPPLALMNSLKETRVK